MVSRSLEKMLLIAIGLSTAVIIGVPVLMYAIDTINTTSQLQEAQLIADQIHNATRNVDTGASNSTTINIWVNPGVTVTVNGNTLTVAFSDNGGAPTTWSATYNHEIVIDDSIISHQDRTLYTLVVTLVGDSLHLSFLEVPI
jgi:uncharacterized protein (UPF0333 family)